MAAVVLPAPLTLFLAWLVVCGFSGCTLNGWSKSEREQEREFARLNQQLLELQRSNNTQKFTYLARFEQVRCVQLCHFQQVCAHAFSVHSQAILRTQSMKLELQRSGTSSKAEGLRLTSALSSARSSLEEGRKLMNECAALQGELARQFSQ